ncbi:hypothetical protein FH972_023342 [Carpinus fangiana]|uniref:Uncharacterized protein n=1 Tax=Carpinus fangiana TaxID=176857 RepID=A0A5N6KVJ6_9ROSI|nr:hypothetical protein FH972_023342 [Carpinus fangiana]
MASCGVDGGGMSLGLTVAVVVDALLENLECHQRLHELVVCVQQAADPLLALDVLDVAQDLATQRLAGLEACGCVGVGGRCLAGFAIDELQRVEQAGRGNARLSDGLRDDGFLLFEVERLSAAARLLGLLVLLGGFINE